MLHLPATLWLLAMLTTDCMADMTTQRIKTVPGWHYTLHAAAACTLKQAIKGIPATLLVLPHGGAASFTARSSEVIAETSGNFSLYPSKETSESIVVDQTYTPDSPNAQSGTAVAQAFSTGSTVEALPGSPAPYTMRQGATVELDIISDTLELVPSTLTTAQEMRVLYSPAEARTTPLIAVPDGVNLHWAGDEEPTWEVGKDYVIQLLQTAPAHIEARLFNAPQGAKLQAPYIIYADNVVVGADFKGQTDGYHQFYQRKDSVTILAQELNTATFAEQVNGNGQFYAAFDALTLRFATFDKETDAGVQFYNSTSGFYTLTAPRATFNSVVTAADIFGGTCSIYAPSATFKSLTSLRAFMGTYSGAQSFHAVFPSVTFENVETIEMLFRSTNPSIIKFYSLNLKKLNDTINLVAKVVSVSSFSAAWKEFFLSVVYGPRLDTDGTPTPVTKIDPATDDPTALEPTELTGTRRTDQSERPTGWGIQDFRVLNEDGTFARDSEGNYIYPEAAHNIKVPLYATARPVAEGGTAAYGEDIAQALADLGERGWTVAYF